MLKVLQALFALLLLGISGVIVGGVVVVRKYSQDLPEYAQLAVYEPPVTTRVHAGDGRLLAEFANERRIFTPIGTIPKRVIRSFLSAEDKNYYIHPGIDITGVARAALANITKLGSDRRPAGASTITQQVAKNFLLSNEVSLERKVKEAVLAFRIEKAFNKDHILELYLNEIYLGGGAYGVAAAALNYFNKSLDELTIAEAAYLAALPKAPNNYHPTRHPEAAKARRDWVIGRMQEDAVITAEEAKAAMAEPLVVRSRADDEVVQGAHFAEEVRRELATRFGEDALYDGGLSVRTTVNPRLQHLADASLRQGLNAYDRHHGWRGPITHFDARPTAAQLAAVTVPGLGEWKLGLVTGLHADHAEIQVIGQGPGSIPLDELKWARARLQDQLLGPQIKVASDVLKLNDVVAVEPISANSYALRQIPKVDGALVAMDPHTGRVLAMSGGYSFERSQFNRATQAMRQPGSAFKPFVYLAALDAGYTPSTIIVDGPFVIDQGPGLGKWKPGNYGHKFYGPSTMRLGLEKSRNLMTVRMAQAVGIDKVAEYAQRFGVITDMPHQLSMALGAGETTLMRLTTGYAMIVNGGKRVTPSLIDRIQDRTGKTIFKHDERPCDTCFATTWHNQAPPELPDTREQIVDPLSAYQMVSMLRGVVERGTAAKLNELRRTLAGKTGTTNDSNDVWFVGFSPDLVVGVFVGFDEPKTLGRMETGGSVAVPIFKDFMAEALKGVPDVPFRVPPGIQFVRVNATTGKPASASEGNTILEAFKPGTEPGSGPAVDADGSLGGSAMPETMIPAGETGGLY